MTQKRQRQTGRQTHLRQTYHLAANKEEFPLRRHRQIIILCLAPDFFAKIAKFCVPESYVISLPISAKQTRGREQTLQSE